MNAESIFHEYNDKVFGFVLHNVKDYALAKDITQDVFLKVCLNESRINEIHDVSNYIFLITRNTLIDHFRKAAHDKKYRKTLKERWMNPIQNLMDQNHYGYILDSALNKLSERQRTIYSLHSLDGKSIGDIARELNLSYFTVKNHLAEARKNLKSLIDSDLLYVMLVCLGVGCMQVFQI